MHGCVTTDPTPVHRDYERRLQGEGRVSDEDLRSRLAEGDRIAWIEVMREYGPALIGYATRMVGDRGAAEDVVQASLVAAWRSIESFEGRSSVKTWIFRIVHNKAVDEIRRRKRFVQPAEDDPEMAYFNDRGRWAGGCPAPQWAEQAAGQLDARELLSRVRAAIDRLPHKHREVMLMKEVYGMETPDICTALDIEPGNLRIRLHRARKALRAAVIHGED